MTAEPATGWQGSTEYRDGDSEDTFIKRNAFGQNNNYGVTSFANPVVGVINGVRGRRAYKKARAEYESRMRAALNQQRQGQYDSDQSTIDTQQSEVNKARQASLKSLDASYNDPSRESARQDAYDTNLNSSLSGIIQDYGKTKQQTALQLAKRGRLGSSYDAERNGAMVNDLNQNVMGAENSANDYYSGLQDADTQQYENLRRALMTSDPQAAQQYQSMAQGVGNDIQRMYANAAGNYRSQQLDREQRNNTSQLVGGLANGGTSYVYNAYGVQNPYGGGY